LPSTQLDMTLINCVDGNLFFVQLFIYCLDEFQATFPNSSTKFLTNHSHDSFTKSYKNAAFQ